MNKTQALAKLKKLFGKNAMWRYDDRAPTAEVRAEAEAKRQALRIAKDYAKQALDRRRAELLADPEYVSLKEAFAVADKAYSANDMVTRWYRVTIGRSTGIAFMVEAEGDNWQDAFDRYDAKRNAKISRTTEAA